MFQSITNAVLNTIFVSIPECIVWVLFTLVFLKRKDLLDMYRWKHNIKQIMIPVIPVAISINIMRYILQINNLVNFIIIEIMMCALVIYMIKKNNFLGEKLNYIKIIFFTILVDFIVIGMAEFFFAIMFSLIMKIGILDINLNVFTNILLSLPLRIIQFFIIIYYIYKKNITIKINFIDVILKDKILALAMFIFILTTSILFFIITRFITESNILINYVLLIQVIVIVTLLSVPSILILTYIISILRLLQNNIQINKEKENILSNID